MTAFGTPFALGIPDAARFVGVSRVVLDDAIRKGDLAARRIGEKGGRWSIKVADLEAWWESLPTEVEDAS